MNQSRTGFIKRGQKESLIRREVANLLTQAGLDYPQLRGLTLTHVELSTDKSCASVFLYTPDGPAKFKEQLGFLKLLTPSLRKALAEAIPGRYVPRVFFKFDSTQEKQQKIEALLDQIKKEG